MEIGAEERFSVILFIAAVCATAIASFFILAGAVFTGVYFAGKLLLTSF